MKKRTTSNRPERIASKVQTLVAGILRANYGDDTILGHVNLVGSAASGGGQFVRLFYYVHDIRPENVQKRLDEITRAIRYELAGQMNQRYVPEIKFEYDDTLERAQRIDDLLNSIEK